MEGTSERDLLDIIRQPILPIDLTAKQEQEFLIGVTDCALGKARQMSEGEFYQIGYEEQERHYTTMGYNK